ncbi:Putative Acetamidase-B [Aspergillus calidoustus]|uniref:amidase n=1 Tax=Aspergillus calidoustus TaxID=454130 RepID=A0A0U5H8L2_ASPCI|nr:Putative Acetamidase-B [Aspergillus calidoustus]
MSSNWEQLAADKRKRLAKTIPQQWRIREVPGNDSVIDYPRTAGILSKRELEITELCASQLVSNLASNSLSAVEVTLAFCKRTAIAQQLTNCVHEFFPEAAFSQAKELEEYFAKHGKPVGPLHGLPVSLKNQLRGYETSMGYISWLGKYDKEDSVMTHLLRKAGAIFYVKTSVPQTVLVCETVNNIIGTTTNPRNRNWSCGGSSGGEGALLAMRGSVLGVGTDSGGSIRVPAAFNSMYGLRSSHGRLPYAKMANSMEGQETTVHSVVGPMGHSVENLRLFVQAVLEQEPWKFDSKVIPMPWRQSEADMVRAKIQTGGLTIGVFNFDCNVLPHPPVLRGIGIAVAALNRNGHKVVPWKPYKHNHGCELMNRVWAADASTDPIGIKELWEIQTERWAYQNEYLEKWREAEDQLGTVLDAIIAPVAPAAAVRHGRFGYSFLINLLDFISVVVLVGFAEAGIDRRNQVYVLVSELDKAMQEEYDPQAYHGAPVAVQVIGRRLSEEKTLAVAKELANSLGRKEAVSLVLNSRL